MRYFTTFFVAVLFFFSGCIMPQAQNTSQKKDSAVVTTYYFIRHAEKDRSDKTNRNPELTEEGRARAKNWANFFADVPLDMVYSTDYNRTKATAAPTAAQKGVEVVIYNPRTLYDADFKNKTQGKTVLIVGHSNTTPAFVNAVVGEKRYSDIDDRNNGNVYQVTLRGDTITSRVFHVN